MEESSSQGCKGITQEKCWNEMKLRRQFTWKAINRNLFMLVTFATSKILFSCPKKVLCCKVWVLNLSIKQRSPEEDWDSLVLKMTKFCGSSPAPGCPISCMKSQIHPLLSVLPAAPANQDDPGHGPRGHSHLPQPELRHTDPAGWAASPIPMSTT